MKKLPKENIQLFCEMEKERYELLNFLQEELAQTLFLAKAILPIDKHELIECITKNLLQIRGFNNVLETRVLQDFGLHSAITGLFKEMHINFTPILIIKPDMLSTIYELIIYRTLQQIVIWLRAVKLNRLHIFINERQGTIAIEVMIYYLNQGKEEREYFENQIQQGTMMTKILFEMQWTLKSDDEKSFLVITL